MSTQRFCSKKKAYDYNLQALDRHVNFLEAQTLVSKFTGGPRLQFLLAVSGATEKLTVFLSAAGARKGRSVEIRTLPFNTLGQTVLTEAVPGEVEVFVLFPWDFIPEADWRSGLPSSALDLAELKDRAQAFAHHIMRRKMARILYVAAPVPPILANPAANANLQTWVATLASTLGAAFLRPDAFSLASYLSTGSPFAGARLGVVAERVIKLALSPSTEPAKVLITDLDNVVWGGVIGEDGIAGIRYTADGVGYRHFLYQTALAKLKREGTLLAAVSRNDAELASEPFRTSRMTLTREDLVTILASYNAKSSQIRELAIQLNLGLDSFVFVDDNPLELEEVARALPEVRTLMFPATDDALPAFFDELCALFPRFDITTEDANRTELYRRRLEGMVPAAAEGADLTGFLRSLKMSITIHDRSEGDRNRAVQLINKTNQFNLNGRRVSDESVAEILAAGGRLYGVTLNDRTGSHGEILACLIDVAGILRAMVMSCRVFQRRVEYAFLSWLADEESRPTALDFAATARNEPMRLFLQDSAFSPRGDGLMKIDIAAFRTAHSDDLALFAITQSASSASS